MSRLRDPRAPGGWLLEEPAKPRAIGFLGGWHLAPPDPSREPAPHRERQLEARALSVTPPAVPVVRPPRRSRIVYRRGERPICGAVMRGMAWRREVLPNPDRCNRTLGHGDEHMSAAAMARSAARRRTGGNS